MSEWRSRPGSQIPAAWLSLDKDDNDVTRFLIYLASALSALIAGIGETALAYLQSLQPPPMQVILTALINDLVTALSTPFVLVLDDYHLISSQAVHEAVTFLLDHQPPHMHLVALTRADPNLPLSGLRVRNQMTELRAADLRFTLEEATIFLNQVMGLVLSERQVEALEERTEGWVAGLQLAALSMQGREDIQGFISALSGSHRYILDYLAEEVLNSQTEAVREFVLRTSILDRLTAPLCNILTGRDDGQETLESLERANLFIIPLDDERHWYRYHHLFTDAIRNCLHQMHPDWIPNLHRHATEWYEHNGFVPDAIHHALAGEDIEKAARLIERSAQPMLMRRELITLDNWLKAVEGQLDKHAQLCVYQAWALFFTGQMSDIERYLQKAEQIVATDTRPDRVIEEDVRGQIAAIRMGVAFVYGDADRAIDFARQALEHLPGSNFEARALVTYTLAGLFWLKGDISAASYAFEELEHNGRTTRNMPVVVMALCSLARIHALKGQLHRAVENYREAIQVASSPRSHLLPIAGEAYAGLGYILYEWNDLDAATDYLERYAEISHTSGVISYRILSQALLARLHQAQGQSNQAFDLLHQAEQLAEHSTLGIDPAALFTSFRTNIWLDGGDLESAGRIVQGRGLSVADTSNWRREPEYIAFVRVLLAQGEYDTGLKLIEQLIQPAEAGELSGYVIELLALQALLFYKKGDIPHALAALERSLSIAQPEGYIRVFVDKGPLMAELLRLAGARKIAQEYISILLSEFPTPQVMDAAVFQSHHIVEPLSKRELEILRLVAEGKSNQQIAETLVIATGTVKKHINNIFGKLGVQSRTQCVARGRELNLL